MADLDPVVDLELTRLPTGHQSAFFGDARPPPWAQVGDWLYLHTTVPAFRLLLVLWA